MVLRCPIALGILAARVFRLVLIRAWMDQLPYISKFQLRLRSIFVGYNSFDCCAHPERIPKFCSGQHRGALNSLRLKLGGNASVADV